MAAAIARSVTRDMIAATTTGAAAMALMTRVVVIAVTLATGVMVAMMVTAGMVATVTMTGKWRLPLVQVWNLRMARIRS